MRQYDVDKGNIKIDNKALKEIDLGEMRSQVGFVPQDNFLFSDILYNNVLLGGEDDSNDSEEVKMVTEIADLYKDVEDFKNGFETVLGERGITLSGGQKQRLSIARAIYGDPKLLIFDDSFSAVDTHTEAAILEGLGKYINNRTTLLISHRVSTEKGCDYIIVMEKGRIIEEGTREKLIGEKKYYYSLYKKQL